MTIGVSTGESYEDEFQYYVQQMQTEEGLPFFQLQEPGLDREGGLDQLKRKREQQDDFDAGVMRTLRPGKEVPDALPGMIINPRDMDLMKSLGKEASLNDPSIMSDMPTMTAVREGFDWLHYTTSIRPPYSHMTPEERDMSVPLHNYDIKKVGDTDPSISIMDLKRGKQAWGDPGPQDGDEDVRTNLATVNPMDPFEAAAERTRTKHPTRFYDFQKKGHLSNANWEFVGKYLLHKLGQTVESAKDAFQAPYKAYKGELDPMSPEALKSMFDLASTMVFAPMPIASRMADGTLGSFAGVNAKTFNLKNAEKAVKLAKKGASREKIWKETGLFQGAEGRWRFEISDAKAKVDLSKFEEKIEQLSPGDKSSEISKYSLDRKKTLKLRDIFDHPELYAAYPELKDVKVRRVGLLDELNNVKGGYNESSNTLFLGELRDKEMKSVILHEMQHVIQEREGFARGGAVTKSPEVIQLIKDFTSAKIKKQEEIIKKMNLKPGDIFGYSNAVRKEISTEGLKPSNILFDMYTKRIEQLQKEGTYEDLKNIIIGEESIRKIDNRAFDEYQAIMGEVEARNVQKRMDLDEVQIRQSYPEDTMDIPMANQTLSQLGSGKLNQQLIKFDRFDEYTRNGLTHYGLEFNKIYKLENIVDNKELYKQYPELRKIKVVRMADEGQYHFDAEKNTLHIGVMDSDTLYNALADVVQQKTRVNPQQAASLSIKDVTSEARIFGNKPLDNLKKRQDIPMIDEKERMFTFKHGNSEGLVIIEATKNSDTAFVRYIGAAKNSKSRDDDVPWSIGPDVLEQLTTALKKEYPNIKYVEGVRMSGARSGNVNKQSVIKRELP